MFCKKCGKQVKDGARFCPYCGTAIINTNQFANIQQRPVNTVPIYNQQLTTNKPKKKKTGLIVGIIIALAIIITAVTLVLVLVVFKDDNKKTDKKEAQSGKSVDVGREMKDYDKVAMEYMEAIKNGDIAKIEELYSPTALSQYKQEYYGYSIEDIIEQGILADINEYIETANSKYGEGQWEFNYEVQTQNVVDVDSVDVGFDVESINGVSFYVTCNEDNPIDYYVVVVKESGEYKVLESGITE